MPAVPPTRHAGPPMILRRPHSLRSSVRWRNNIRKFKPLIAAIISAIIVWAWALGAFGAIGDTPVHLLEPPCIVQEGPPNQAIDKHSDFPLKSRVSSPTD
jgi:hypothetical protein